MTSNNLNTNNELNLNNLGDVDSNNFYKSVFRSEAKGLNIFDNNLNCDETSSVCTSVDNLGNICNAVRSSIQSLKQNLKSSQTERLNHHQSDEARASTQLKKRQLQIVNYQEDKYRSNRDSKNESKLMNTRAESELESTKDYSSLMISYNLKHLKNDCVAHKPKKLCEKLNQTCDSSLLSKIESCDKRLSTLHKEFESMHKELKSILSRNDCNKIKTSSKSSRSSSSFQSKGPKGDLDRKNNILKCTFASSVSNKAKKKNNSEIYYI